MELEQALTAAGATVLGPVPTIEAALDLVRCQAPPEAAVLDVNLAGETVYPVANLLAARGIPFVFTTGYDRMGLPERYAAVRSLEKPFALPEFFQEPRRLLDRGSAAAGSD
jgi:CheY-like chemotaxis protein